MQAMKDLTITPRMAEILKIFLEDPAEPRYGLELMQLTGLQSGSLYPMLARLEGAGWLTGGKEDINPRTAGRPPRKHYIIADEAAAIAHSRLTALSDQYRPPDLNFNSLRTRETLGDSHRRDRAGHRYRHSIRPG